MFELNYAPLLRQIKQDFRRWDRETFTWFGRTNIIKMNVMPRVLYLLQTLPIKIPSNFLKDLRSRFLRFIWAGKPARVRRNILALPKGKGGIGFPDPVRYREALQLARVMEWCASVRKPHVQLEQATTKIPLEGIAWIEKSELPTIVKKHPLTGATICSIYMIFKKTNLSPNPSPMTPVLGAPDFLPGLIDWRYEALKHKGKSRLIDFSRDCRLMTRGEIEGEVTEDLDYFRSMQLGAYIRSKIKTFPVIQGLSSFERSCLNGESMRHSLSYFYEILTNLEAPQELNFMQAWEKC